jgi:Domain of unknown function (DUF4407)
MISRGLLWLSGADEGVLAECPTERLKFIATGGVVLTAAALAVLSATFTFNDFLGAPLALAILAGLCWAAIIMNFDRWLLISIRRQESPFLTVLMALPRLFLAVIVGLVVAQPLVLRVFEPEVNRQVARDRSEELTLDERHLEAQYLKIADLKTEKKSLEAAITNVNADEALTQDPAYAMLARELSALEHRESVAQQEATCELAGTCGTRHVGAGQVYRHKLSIAEGIRKEVNEVRQRQELLGKKIVGTESSLAAQKIGYNSAQLKKVDQELQTLEGQRNRQEKKYVKESKARSGLLDRIEALAILSNEHLSIRNIQLLLWLLILAIDSMPAFAKTIMSLGRESLYEQVLDQVEAEAVSSATSRREAAEETHKLSAATVVTAAEVGQELELSARKELVEKTVEAQKKIAESFIDVWEQAMAPFATQWAKQWVDRYMQETQEASSRPSNGGAKSPRADPGERGHQSNNGNWAEQTHAWPQDRRNRNLN